MNKVLLSDIEKETFKRTTLIAIPNLSELLSLNDNFTAKEVFFSIVKLAIQRYQNYFPLALMQKVYIVPTPSGEYDFIDNFDAYIAGKISEDDINLIPNAVLGFTTNYYTNFSQMIRLFRYPYPPHMTDFGYSAGRYYVRTLCDHPIWEDYNPITKDYTDKCAIYFFTKNGPRWKIFFDEVYLQLCRYLINLKKNMDMPNMPIQMFQGLEEDFNNLNASQDQLYQQNLGTGDWMI